MGNRCIPIAELDDLLRANRSDPRFTHLESCPRCRARLAAYRAYLELPPEGKDDREAEAELLIGQALDGQILGRKGDKRAGGLRRFLDAIVRRPAPWRIPALRPALGIAALVAAGILVLRAWDPPHRGRGVMRGETVVDAPVAVRVEQERLRPDGGLEFRWHRLEGADRYRLRIYTAELEEVGSFDAALDTLLVLAPDRLLRLPSASDAAYWEVEAWSGGDLIAVSSPAELALPVR